MKRFLCFFLLLATCSVSRAAVPSFSDFLTNYFTTTGNKVGLRTNLVFTNAVFNSITFTNGTNSQTFFFPGTNLLSGQLLTVLQLSSNQFEIHGTNVMAPSVVVDTVEELAATEIPLPGISLIGFVRDSRGGFFVYQPLSIKPVDNFRVFATTGPGRWERTDDPNIIRPEWGKVTGGNVTNATLAAALVLQGGQGYGRVVVSGTDEFLYSDDVPLAENSVLYFDDGAQATGLTISANGITNAAVIGAYHIAAVASTTTGAYYLTNSTVILAGSKFLGYTGSTINQSGTTRLHVIDSKGRPFTADAFGAGGDDVTDDTVALNTGALISGLQNQPFRLDGTYKISSMISITNALTMEGVEGRGKIRMSVTNSPILRVTASDVTIKGLTLSGVRGTAGTDYEVGIDVLGASEAVPVRNFKSIGNVITNLGFYGIYMTHVKDFAVDNNKINHISYAGVMGLSVSNGVISRNEVFKIVNIPNSYGIALSRVGTTNLVTEPRSSDVRVTENFLHSMPAWTAIDSHGGARISVQGNIIYGAKIGIGIGTSNAEGNVPLFAPLDCVIEGNIIDSGKTDGSAWYGIFLHGALGVPGTPIEKATGVIAGNTVRGYGDQSNSISGAIYVYATQGLPITGNKVFEPSPTGILLYTENYGAAVSGNTVIDPWTDDGVGVGAASAVSFRADFNSAHVGGNSFLRSSRTNAYVLTRGIEVAALMNNFPSIGVNYNDATDPLVDGSGNAQFVPGANIHMNGLFLTNASRLHAKSAENLPVVLETLSSTTGPTAGQLKLRAAPGGYGAGIYFESAITNGTFYPQSSIEAEGEGVWHDVGTADSFLRLSTAINGVLSEKMRITSAGHVGISSDEIPDSLLTVGTNDGFQVNFIGDIVRIRNLPTSFPGTNAVGYMYNDGTGRLDYLPGGGSGAPTTSSYLTLGLDAGLTAERVLTAGSGISFVDTGANGTLTISSSGGGATINATDGYLPYRTSATTFGDSPWYRISTNQAGFNSTNFFFQKIGSSLSIGESALLNGGEGIEDVAIGYEAALSAAGGGGSSENTAVGAFALRANDGGVGNTAVGHSALRFLITGDSNTAIGGGALNSGTGVELNTAIGEAALGNTTTGDRNVTVGAEAGLVNITGSENVAVGYRAETAVNSNTNSIVIGSRAVGQGVNTAVIGNTNIAALFVGTTQIWPGGGTGDFVSPASSTDNAIVRFDSTTGKLGQNSVVTISDAGAIAAAASLTATNVIAGGTLTSAATITAATTISAATGVFTNALTFGGTTVSVVGHAHAGEDITSGTVANARLTDAIRVTTVGFTAFDSTAVPTGKTKGFFRVPYAATITGYSITVDAGTATIKTWKIASGTAKPTIANVISTAGVAISSGTAVISSTTADFTTTAVAADDMFAWDITASSGVTELTFQLELTK